MANEEGNPGEPVEFSDDTGYFAWLAVHPNGYVLSLGKKGPLLHRATCTHLDRHNNPGALTEPGRATRKVCASSKEL
jgi:hypothetical protein